MTTAGRAKSPYNRLFRNRNFMALWLGQAVSFLGDYFYFLAIPVMVNQLTGSALMVGMAAISEAVPMLLLGPIAGVFVDRWNRKTTMIVSDLLRGLLVLLCLLVKTPDQVWIFYLAGFLLSCVSRFFFPAQNAALPLVVSDPQDLLSANGLMQSVLTMGMLAGPALAGFTIGLWGPSVAFVFDSASFFISAAAITFIRYPGAARRSTPGENSLRALSGELKEGLVFMFRNEFLKPLIAGFMVAQVSAGAIHVIWVPYMQRRYNVGAEGLGIVDSAQGVGMLISGLALGFLAARFKKIPMIIACLIVIGLFFIGMGLAPVFGMIIVLSVGIGLAVVPVQAALTTILQIVVPDEKRGRVGSALNAMGTASGLLAMAAASLFGEQFGLSNVYIAGGFINLAAALLAVLAGKEPEASQPKEVGVGA